MWSGKRIQFNTDTKILVVCILIFNLHEKPPELPAFHAVADLLLLFRSSLRVINLHIIIQMCHMIDVTLVKPLLLFALNSSVTVSFFVNSFPTQNCWNAYFKDMKMAHVL